MSECALYRKEMALLASEASPCELPSMLRDHFAECPRCREYWEQINAVCVFCTTAVEGSDGFLPRGFHEEWVNRKDEGTAPAPTPVFSILKNWPLKAAVAVFVVLLAAVPVLHRRKSHLSEPVSVRRSPPDHPSTVTLLDYRMAASDSELDLLLRGQVSSSSTRTYTRLTRSEEETDY